MKLDPFYPVVPDSGWVAKLLPVGTKLVPLRAVAPAEPPKTKVVPNEYINAAGNNVLNSFREYAGPLVGALPKVGWFEQIAQSMASAGAAG